MIREIECKVSSLVLQMDLIQPFLKEARERRREQNTRSKNDSLSRPTSQTKLTKDSRLARDKPSKERPQIPKLKVVSTKNAAAEPDFSVINYHSSFSSVNNEQDLAETLAQVEANRDKFN